MFGTASYCQLMLTCFSTLTPVFSQSCCFFNHCFLGQSLTYYLSCVEVTIVSSFIPFKAMCISASTIEIMTGCFVGQVTVANLATSPSYVHQGPFSIWPFVFKMIYRSRVFFTSPRQNPCLPFLLICLLQTPHFSLHQTPKWDVDRQPHTEDLILYKHVTGNMLDSFLL